MVAPVPRRCAPATGKGSVWIPRRNLASLHDRTLHPTVDPVEQVAFLAVPDGSAWQAVYYDTPETLTEKLLLADDRGLAGAGVWALGYERGLPGYAKVLATFGAGRLTTSSMRTPFGSAAGEDRISTDGIVRTERSPRDPRDRDARVRSGDRDADCEQ